MLGLFRDGLCAEWVITYADKIVQRLVIGGAARRLTTVVPAWLLVGVLIGLFAPSGLGLCLAAATISCLFEVAMRPRLSLIVRGENLHIRRSSFGIQRSSRHVKRAELAAFSVESDRLRRKVWMNPQVGPSEALYVFDHRRDAEIVMCWLNGETVDLERTEISAHREDWWRRRKLDIGSLRVRITDRIIWTYQVTATQHCLLIEQWRLGVRQSSTRSKK